MKIVSWNTKGSISPGHGSPQWRWYWRNQRDYQQSTKPKICYLKPNITEAKLFLKTQNKDLFTVTGIGIMGCSCTGLILHEKCTLDCYVTSLIPVLLSHSSSPKRITNCLFWGQQLDFKVAQFLSFRVHQPRMYMCVYVCVCACIRVNAKLLQLCPTLCDPMDHSFQGSSVSGILQARILEWVAIPSSRGSSWPRDWTQVSCVSCLGRQVLYH